LFIHEFGFPYDRFSDAGCYTSEGYKEEEKKNEDEDWIFPLEDKNDQYAVLFKSTF